MPRKARSQALIEECLKNGQGWHLDDLSREIGSSKLYIRRGLKTLAANHVAVVKKEKRRHVYYIDEDFFHFAILEIYHVETETFYEFKIFNARGALLDSSFEEHMDNSLSALIGKIADYYKKDPLIKSLAIMYPGPVNNGYLYPGAVHYLDNVNLKELLERRFPIQVVIENDANAALYGYAMKHPEVEDAILFYQPNGVDVGVGMLFNGKIYRGYNGTAGELKLMHDDELMGNAVYNLKDALQRTILLLNPQKVILHSFILDHLEFARHLDNVPDALQPEVDLLEDISGYFDEGLKRLAVEVLHF